MKEEKVMLSDEAMDQVAGGVVLVCELKHGDRGDYVQVERKESTGSITSGSFSYQKSTNSVSVGKFEQYLQRMQERYGSVTVIGKDGSPFSI